MIEAALLTAVTAWLVAYSVAFGIALWAERPMVGIGDDGRMVVARGLGLPPRWINVDGLTDDLMICAAAARTHVRLVDGRITTLVRWRGKLRQRNLNNCRVEFPTGRRATLPCSHVVQVEVWTEAV